MAVGAMIVGGLVAHFVRHRHHATKDQYKPMKSSDKGSHMSPEENKRIAREFMEEMFNKGNVENANRFVSPDFIYHAMGEDINGLDKFKACVAIDHTTFRDMRLTYIDGVAEGSKVATTWVVEGIQEREFSGIPATKKKFETVGVIIFRFADGQIKEGWPIVDGLRAAIDLGLIKASFDNK